MSLPKRWTATFGTLAVGGALLVPLSPASAQVDPNFELMAVVANGRISASGDLTTVDDLSRASYRYSVFHNGRRVGGGSGQHVDRISDRAGSQFEVGYRAGPRESVEGRWTVTVTVSTPAHYDCDMFGCVWEPAGTRTRSASAVVARQSARPILILNSTNRRLLCLSNRTPESREPTLTLLRRTKERRTWRSVKIRKCVLYTGLRVRSTAGWQQFRLRATGPDFRVPEYSARVKVKGVS